MSDRMYHQIRPALHDGDVDRGERPNGTTTAPSLAANSERHRGKRQNWETSETGKTTGSWLSGCLTSSTSNIPRNWILRRSNNLFSWAGTPAATVPGTGSRTTRATGQRPNTVPPRPNSNDSLRSGGARPRSFK